MLIIIISGLCVLGGIIWYIYDAYSIGSLLLLIIGGIILLSSLLLLVANPIEINSKIQGFKAVEYTVQTERGNDNIENAALKIKIADENSWLAETQYYNNTIFGLWIPDTIEELNFID